MDNVKIFVSHSTKYKDIAKSLGLSLQALASEPLLDLRISEEMAGATDWRQWIEDKVRTANIFVLLYPHPNMDMGWCNYELGRFYDHKDKNRYIVCIKNTDIPQPPPAFQPYQAYDGDEAGFGKFIKELFEFGTFTEGRPLNKRIGSPGDDYYSLSKKVANQLAQQFAEARVREHFYERRLVLSVRYNDAKQLDMEESTIQGNSEGLAVLGFDQSAVVKWSTIRQAPVGMMAWPTELERTMPSITSGAMPPTLPPFRTSTGLYIPVIAKAESVDNLLRQLIILFVATNVDQLRPLLDWSVSRNMPDTFKFLVQIVRMVFTARWEILEPRYREAKYRAPSTERCSEIVRSVIADYDDMQANAEREGLGGLDKFYAAFHSDLRPDVRACGDEWTRLMNGLRAAATINAEELSGHLKDLLRNNWKWLGIAAKEFMLLVTESV
jgi:hypothetical protein